MLRRRVHQLRVATAHGFVARRLISSSSSAAASSRGCSAAAKRRVLVPVADGSEEIETVCIVDTLVRAQCDVTLASVEPGRLQVKCSRGVNIVADCSIENCSIEDAPAWDAIALPGGLVGAENLRDCHILLHLIKEQRAAGRLLAAVCASPAVVLAHHRLLDGLGDEEATCYPAPDLQRMLGSKWSAERVVCTANVLTSQGPGTSLEFSLAIVAALQGEDAATKLASEMLVAAPATTLETTKHNHGNAVDDGDWKGQMEGIEGSRVRWR